MEVTQFKGTFSRGTEDTTPEDHFLDSLNLEFPFSGVDTRKGTVLDLTLANIRRKVLYKRINESPRMLILVDGGMIYDSTSLSAPILTIAGMTDFSAAFFYNRAYISPHDGIRGLVNETVRVYDGTTVRIAGGSQPTGTMLASNSASSGKVDIGTHLIAVVIESPSGHHSKPGPVIFASVVAVGAKKIDLTGIPLGPAGTVRRRLIATRAIETYSGDQVGQEYFYIPNGVIENNTATTFTVDFYDSELQDDAGDLFFIRSTIPAGLVLSSYQGRMLVANRSGNESVMLVSKRNEPETFDETDDLIIVDPTEAGGVTNAIEHHGMLIIMKSFRAYTTSDNGAEPSTWEVLPFDKSIGTEVHGIGTILDANGITIDRFLMASRVGLVLYDGTFREPELTFKIYNIWKRINQAVFQTIEVALNPIDKQIFITVPLDGATSPNYLIYGDYAEGLSYDTIKWTLWKFPYSPTTIVVDLVNNVPMLKIGSHDGNVYKKTTATNDNNVAIDSFIQFALLPQSKDGNIRHYNWFRSKIQGSGNVQVTLCGQNATNPQTYTSFALAGTGNDTTRLINFEGQRCALKLRVSNINEYFRLNSLVLNYSDRWLFRPS